MKRFTGWFWRWPHITSTRTGTTLRRMRLSSARWTTVQSETKGNSDARTFHWWLAVAAFILGPVAIASLLLAVFCGGGLWDCAPVWHDEVWYYNEISVFRTAGWQGGYTVSHEWPAKVAAVRFGSHGPFFPALYGAITRFTGLPLAVIPLLNAGFLLLASAFWVACCRPTMRQAALAAFLMVTFWPLMLYVPTSMQEVLHLAIGIALAGLTVQLIRRPRNRFVLGAALILVVAASQLRVTWSLVIVPLLWVAYRPRTGRQWLLVLGTACLLIGGLFLESMLTTAPYPNFVADLTARAKESPLAALGMVTVHALKGVVRYFGPTKDTLVQVGMRYQTLMIVGAAVYFLRHPPRVSCDRESAGATDTNTVCGFVLLNLACVVGFVMVLYDVFDWRDYRVVAPHLLLALLVLVGCDVQGWMRGYATVAVLLAAFAIPQFVKFHRPRVEFAASTVAQFSQQVAGAIEYQPGGSGWDNTLLIDIDPLKSPLLAGLPGGIGVSVVNYWDRQAWPPQSKYVLLSKELAARLGIPPTMHKVAHTELGDVYVQDRPLVR